MTNQEIDIEEARLRRERKAKERKEEDAKKEACNWWLNITEEQFDSIYFGLGMDKAMFRRQPKTYEEFREYSMSKLWRMNNWYKVVDKDGDKVWFVMNYAQHIAYARQLRHSRSIILKSRQRGISTFFLINYFDDAITLDNLTVGMQSYGLEESAALLEKLTVAWEELSDMSKGLVGIGLVKNNTKAMGFTNGSQVKVATSFRGNTLHRLHVSELGKIANKDPKKARELKTGTLQAIKPGNPVAIESTAEGQYNAFHDEWYMAVDKVGDRGLKDFDPVFLSWVDDPDCQATIPQEIDEETAEELERIEAEWAEYANIPDFKLVDEQKWWYVGAKDELQDKFHQEYPHTPDSAFAAAKDGAYYSKLWRKSGTVWTPEMAKLFGRERLYDPLLVVHTAWDLGRNDMMVIVFFQVFGKELRIVDEYHNSGEDLEHYYNKLVEIRKDKGYAYGTHVLPHDAKVTDLSSPISRKARLRQLGLRRLRVLKRTKDVNTDIEHVRTAIPKMAIDPVTANYIIKTMGRYTKKWDDMLGTFKDKPLHNEWSNPADAVRYMVMARMHDTSSKFDSSSADDSGGPGGKRRRSKSNVVDGMAM